MFIIEKTSKQKETVKITQIQHAERTTVIVYAYFFPVLSLYIEIHFKMASLYNIRFCNCFPCLYFMSLSIFPLSLFFYSVICIGYALFNHLTFIF